MNRVLTVVLAAASVGQAAWAQDADTIIENARQRLGDVDSITYSGSARNVSFQQCGANATSLLCQGTHDPMRPILDYVRVIDVDNEESRHAGRTMNIGPGGSTAITPGTFFQQVTSEQAGGDGAWATALEYYITPWGFLDGADEQGATVTSQRMHGQDLTVLSWSPDHQAPSGESYVVNGYIGPDNLVRRVETWVGENILGDMHVVADYADWRDFGGFLAPTRISQTRGGWPFFDVDVTAARANPSDINALAPVPDETPRGFGPGASEFDITAEELGDGLYRLTTGPGSYDSLIVEFDDHLMMLEAGQSQARATAYVAEVKRMFPNKPIRYIMVTHPHSDHTGGLPVLVAEGATIIAQENSREFFERAFSTPRTLLDDALARNPRAVKVETVGEFRSYSDGQRTVEFYHIWPAPHSNALLVAYIPQEKILFQGDFSLPQPGQPGNDHVQALVPALEALGVVDFDRYINVHASAEPQTKAMLWSAVGR